MNTTWIVIASGLNAVLIGTNLWLVYRRIRASKETNWRFWLPRLNVPMIGLGASYGVFAFNSPFLPLWAAIVQAGSLESTYVGMASMDDADPKTASTKKTIAMWAGWLSFGENLVAGVWHARPDVLAWLLRPGWGSLIVLILLSSVHASQIWIAYHSATLVFHASPSVAVKVSNVTQRVKSLGRRPASMRRPAMAAKMTAYPAPQRVSTTTPDKPLTPGTPDQRAVQARHLRDVEKMTYSEIALHLGLKTRQSAENLYKHGKTYAPRKPAPKK